jgi:trimethylamine:corrinoid methyltransferase-like protein
VTIKGVKQLLKECQPPSLDPAKEDALNEFITQRKDEIASTQLA